MDEHPLEQDIQWYAQDELRGFVVDIVKRIGGGVAENILKKFREEVPQPRTIMDLNVYLRHAAAAMIIHEPHFTVDPGLLPRNRGERSGDRTEQ